MASNDEPRAPADSAGRRTEPITNLLKRHNVELSAAKANRILLAKGILEERTRPSETVPGKLRTYKSLTGAGINRVQQLVAETSPRYFEDSFEELVSKYLAQD